MGEKPENSNADKPNYENEWDEITRHLVDLDRLSPRGAGPRDWVAAESPDTAFDPSQLPPPPPAHSHSIFDRIVLGLAIGFITGTLVGLFGIVQLPSWLLGVCALSACVATAGAIFLYVPKHRDNDDDGVRL